MPSELHLPLVVRTPADALSALRPVLGLRFPSDPLSPYPVPADSTVDEAVESVRHRPVVDDDNE